jgi:hypothetical protein
MPRYSGVELHCLRGRPRFWAMPMSLGSAQTRGSRLAGLRWPGRSGEVRYDPGALAPPDILENSGLIGQVRTNAVRTNAETKASGPKCREFPVFGRKWDQTKVASVRPIILCLDSLQDYCCFRGSQKQGTRVQRKECSLISVRFLCFR